MIAAITSQQSLLLAANPFSRDMAWCGSKDGVALPGAGHEETSGVGVRVQEASEQVLKKTDVR